MVNQVQSDGILEPLKCHFMFISIDVLIEGEAGQGRGGQPDEKPFHHNLQGNRPRIRQMSRGCRVKALDQTAMTHHSAENLHLRHILWLSATSYSLPPKTAKTDIIL